MQLFKTIHQREDLYHTNLPMNRTSQLKKDWCSNIFVSFHGSSTKFVFCILFVIWPKYIKAMKKQWETLGQDVFSIAFGQRSGTECMCGYTALPHPCHDRLSYCSYPSTSTSTMMHLTLNNSYQYGNIISFWQVHALLTTLCAFN
jgi:hypothetical protein